MAMLKAPGSTTTSGKRGISLRRLDWPVVIAITAIHLGCLLAPFHFSWSALCVTVVLAWLTGGVGITLCYHRLLTHRSFKTPKWFEYVLTTIGCLAWQGGPAKWVGTHRIHHAHSDEELDPHTPKHGFTWSHVFWCLHHDEEDARVAAKDLMRDPVTRWLDRLFWVPQFGLVVLLWLLGGWSWVIWGVCVRTVFVYHSTWFVNSAAHTWGYRNFNTKDLSTNLWWVAIFSMGEGWHNNHHAHQRSAAHGLRWFEIDPTYWTIRVLSLFGLAREIVLPRPEQMPGADKPVVVPEVLSVKHSAA